MQYALTLQNNGPSDTAQMRVADLLPASFEWVAGGSYTPTAVAGALAGLSVAAPSCSATPAAITVAGQQQTISCVLTGAFPGDSAPSNNVVLTLWARPKAGYYTGPYAADVTNTATVTPGLDGGGAPIAIDTNPANNSGPAVTQVQAASISGTVFEDRDRSGSNGGVPQAAAEPRIAGVSITLTGSDLLRQPHHPQHRHRRQRQLQLCRPAAIGTGRGLQHHRNPTGGLQQRPDVTAQQRRQRAIGGRHLWRRRTGR